MLQRYVVLVYAVVDETLARAHKFVVKRGFKPLIWHLVVGRRIEQGPENSRQERAFGQLQAPYKHTGLSGVPRGTVEGVYGEASA